MLERRHLVGGAAVTEEVWPGYRVPTASYVVSLLAPRIIQELELKRYGYHVYPLDPAYFAPFPDGRGILLWDDPGRAAEEIARVSKKDAARYPDYVHALDELARLIRPLLARIPPSLAPSSFSDLREALSLAVHIARRRRDLPRLVDVMTMSCADFLEQYFQHELVKGALAPGGVIGVWGGPMSPGSAYVLLHHRMGEVDGTRGSWAFVRGGMGALSEAIAASARAAGAEIVTGAEVEAIEVAAGRARGVRLTDGKLLRARAVASGVHPKTTFLSLLGRGVLADEQVQDIERYRTRGPAAKVNFALSELPDFAARPGREAGPQHPEIIISPSLSYLERAWDDAKYGRFSSHPMIDCVIPSSKDPTIAPPGRHVMSCFVQYVPYELADGSWREGGRDALADAVDETIASYAPNFRDCVLHRQVLTPADLEERFGLIGGNIFHGEMSLDQLFSLRPAPWCGSYRTPVPGLYLCGSGTHPGGGVTGLCGYNAARVIRKDLRDGKR